MVRLYLSLAAGSALAIASAWTDHRTGRIPNGLTLMGLALGLILGFAFGGMEGLLVSLAGALVVALVPLLLFKMGSMGGGDVKLLGALGALTGLELGLEIEALSFVVGATQGMVVWARKGRLRSGMTAVACLAVPFVRKRLAQSSSVVEASETTIRFGPAVMLSTLFIVVLVALEGRLS